jgi:hypothetical protein
VSRQGSSYVAIAATTNDPPESSATKWSLMSQQGSTGATGAQGAQGAQGPQGPQGPTGSFSTANVTVRSANFTSVTSASVNCNAGEKATGGGVNYTAGQSNNFKPGANAPVMTGSTPTGWQVSSNDAVTGTVYAICVS